MSIAWFDAFRENGAPTWYGDNTPTPVLFDLGLVVIIWLFATPTIAFILILPGIRRFRALSTFCFLFSITIGASIALCLHYPGWHYGEVKIFTTLRAHSRQRIAATLGVNVGLTHVNITLLSDPSSLEEFSTREYKLPSIEESDISLLLFGNNSFYSTTINNISSSLQTQQIEEEEFYPHTSQLIYNERFEFDDVSGMEVGEVLQKGLPFPILRVMEYLSVDRTGFLWGKQYRLAGYYTMATLWLAFALWILQIIFLCVVPNKFGQISLICGICLLFSDCVYAWYTPGSNDLYLMFPGRPNDLSSSSSQKLHFHLSTCFYIILFAGMSSTIVGLLFWLLEKKTSFQLETFFSIYLDRNSINLFKNKSKIWRTYSSSNNNRLPTPRGSFSSQGRPSQRIGWKRRRRSLWRTAKPWAAHFHQLFPETRPPRTSIRFGIDNNSSKQPSSCLTTTTTHSSSSPSQNSELNNNLRTRREQQQPLEILNCSKLNSYDDDISITSSITSSPIIFDNTFGDSIDSSNNWRHNKDDNNLFFDKIAEERV